jgi:hypothetical protein
LQRNETVASDVQIGEPADKQGLETRVIVLPKKPIRYDEFINNAMEGDSNFWKYHPITNNCQLFVLQCLEKNNITVPEELRTFIYQDAEQVLSNSPLLKNIAIGSTSLANRIGKIVEGINAITIQNGTPYTIRVKTHYAGESAFLKTCLPDDFLLESGQEKTVSHGICLIDGIKVAGSFIGGDDIKDIPHEKLQQTADIFVENSFVGKGKSRAEFLIRSTGVNKFVIESINLLTEDLKKLAAETRANPKLNLNWESAVK